MNKKNGQANGRWRNVVASTAMTIDNVIGLLDAFTIFLALLLGGTWIQQLFN